jgi:hypothetical protein
LELKNIILALELKFENLSSDSDDDEDQNSLEEAAIDDIREAKINLQMISV